MEWSQRRWEEEYGCESRRRGIHGVAGEAGAMARKTRQHHQLLALIGKGGARVIHTVEEFATERRRQRRRTLFFFSLFVWKPSTALSVVMDVFSPLGHSFRCCYPLPTACADFHTMDRPPRRILGWEPNVSPSQGCFGPNPNLAPFCSWTNPQLISFPNPCFSVLPKPWVLRFF